MATLKEKKVTKGKSGGVTAKKKKKYLLSWLEGKNTPCISEVSVRRSNLMVV